MKNTQKMKKSEIMKVLVACEYSAMAEQWGV